MRAQSEAEIDFSKLNCSIFSLCSFSCPFPLPLSKKIDEENEANLLAVLTETLDSIPVDEDGLPSFEALADGDVTNASDQSCPSTPDGSPRTPEPEEPSLVRLSLSLCFCPLHNPLLQQTTSILLIFFFLFIWHTLCFSHSPPAWPSHTPDKEMLQACDQKRVRALQAAPLAGQMPWLCSELIHAAQMIEQIKDDLCSCC